MFSRQLPVYIRVAAPQKEFGRGCPKPFLWRRGKFFPGDCVPGPEELLPHFPGGNRLFPGGVKFRPCVCTKDAPGGEPPRKILLCTQESGSTQRWSEIPRVDRILGPPRKYGFARCSGGRAKSRCVKEGNCSPGVRESGPPPEPKRNPIGTGLSKGGGIFPRTQGRFCSPKGIVGCPCGK